MAVLRVTPYATIDVLSGGLLVPALVEPPLSDPIVVDFTSGAAKGGGALPSGTQYVELHADANCHWTLQDQTAAAAATTSKPPMSAELPIVRRIPPGTPPGGWGVSAIARS